MAEDTVHVLKDILTEGMEYTPGTLTIVIDEEAFGTEEENVSLFTDEGLNIGTLSAGSSGYLEFEVRVNSDFFLGTVTNQAFINCSQIGSVKSNVVENPVFSDDAAYATLKPYGCFPGVRYERVTLNLNVGAR